MSITHDNRKYVLKIAYVDWIDLLWIQIVPKGVFFGSTGALRRNGKKRDIFGWNKSMVHPLRFDKSHYNGYISPFITEIVLCRILQSHFENRCIFVHTKVNLLVTFIQSEYYT